jgi:hypothetical protein
MQDSTNETNSRVLALAIRPVGKTALSSSIGKSQSSRTGLTIPAATAEAYRCRDAELAGKSGCRAACRQNGFLGLFQGAEISFAPCKRHPSRGLRSAAFAYSEVAASFIRQRDSRSSILERNSFKMGDVLAEL